MEGGTLSSSHNLNNYKGTAYTGHIFMCDHPQNYPTNDGGFLFVISNSQLVITYDSLYIRFYTGDSWTSWRVIHGTVVS